MKFKKTTLPNGLRIITVPTKGNPAATVMVLVETGSNYESKAQNGLSHFLEHMCFKGTKKRPTALDISRELNSLGAMSNAGTSNELTVYYAKAAKKHFKKVLDILSDMYLNPTLPANEIEKERGVILQEISMYEDQPSSTVHNVLRELLYGNTSAGRPIIGPRENIKKFSRTDFINYRNTHYVAGKTTIIVAGDIKQGQVVSEIKKCFEHIPKGKVIGKAKVVDKQNTPALKIQKKKTDQTHLILGFRAFNARDKRVPILNVLATILGRGSSSRLFEKMRNEMGACYYVYAAAEDYTDHGTLIIPAGIEKRRLKEVVKTIISECKKLKDEPVSPHELNKAKEYSVGRMYLDLETTDSLAEFYADQEVSAKKLKKPQELEKEIRKVTAQDVTRVAREIFRDENLNLAVVGNISGLKPIRKVLTFK